MGYNEHVLLNRAYERFAGLSRRTRELARRAHGDRRPVVVVPSILGSKLVDPRGELLWGSWSRLYAPRSFDQEAVVGGLLAEFPIVDGVVAYDVFGGLVRFLARVGGYRVGDDLHVLSYDWRAGIPAAADALHALLDRVGAEVDLVCVSTGGLVARYCLARTPHAIGRAVYIGTPHRGSFAALSYLVDGVQPAPLGRRVAAVDVAKLQTAWDALPHPDERVFVDGSGRRLDHDLYDPATWRRLGIDRGVADLDRRLAHAREVWRVIDGARSHPIAVVVGARHLPTIERVVVTRGAGWIPPCTPPRLRRSVPGIYEPGDSSVSARSLCAAPRIARTIYTTPSEHRLLPSDRDVHHGVLEALLDAR